MSIVFRRHLSTQRSRQADAHHLRGSRFEAKCGQAVTDVTQDHLLAYFGEGPREFDALLVRIDTPPETS